MNIISLNFYNKHALGLLWLTVYWNNIWRYRMHFNCNTREGPYILGRFSLCCRKFIEQRSTTVIVPTSSIIQHECLKVNSSPICNKTHTHIIFNSCNKRVIITQVKIYVSFNIWNIYIRKYPGNYLYGIYTFLKKTQCRHSLKYFERRTSRNYSNPSKATRFRPWLSYQIISLLKVGAINLIYLDVGKLLTLSWKNLFLTY